MNQEQGSPAAGTELRKVNAVRLLERSEGFAGLWQRSCRTDPEPSPRAQLAHGSENRSPPGKRACSSCRSPCFGRTTKCAHCLAFFLRLHGTLAIRKCTPKG